ISVQWALLEYSANDLIWSFAGCRSGWKSPAMVESRTPPHTSVADGRSALGSRGVMVPPLVRLQDDPENHNTQLEGDRMSTQEQVVNANCSCGCACEPVCACAAPLCNCDCTN